MRSLLRMAFALSAASVVLAACSDQPTSAPTAPARLPTAAPAVFSAVCDVNALKSNARDYVASNQDLLYTIIGNLQKSINQNGLNATATNLAFDGLARLAAVRGTSAQKSGTTGAVFNGLTRGFIGCMEQYITQTVDNSFDVSGALGSGWMYEVRGGANDAAVGAYERGASPSPYWAATAPSGWAASVAATSQAKRFLIYGFRDPSFIVADTKIGSAFDIKTVPVLGAPVLSFSSPLFIGLCNVNPATTVRVQHVNTVLTKQELACDDPPTFALESSGLRSLNPLFLAQRAIDFLAPKPAYAFGFGGVGGAVSELSPSVVIDMRAVKLEYRQGIANGQVTLPLADTLGRPIQVKVTTQGGTPLPGLTVTLGIFGNSSSIAFFQQNGVTSSVVTRTTDSDGNATFDNPSVFLTKAGGYQLVVTSTFDSGNNAINSAPFVSNSFNYQNK